MLFRANNLTPTPMLLRLRAAAKAPSAGIDGTSSWPPNFINRANPGPPIELRNLEEVLGTTRDFLRAFGFGTSTRGPKAIHAGLTDIADYHRLAISRTHGSPRRLHRTAGSLFAGALKLFVEIAAECAGASLLLATMAGQHRDRILRRGRQQIFRGDLHM